MTWSEDQIIRCQRLEVSDRDGQVRLVAGLLDTGLGTGETYGLSLRGPDGAERAALSIDDQGPTLVFVRAGNISLQLGVDDPLLTGDHDGAYITVAGADGTPVLRLWVEQDSSLRIEAAPVPPAPGSRPSSA